jgi:hypothetical protein
MKPKGKKTDRRPSQGAKQTRKTLKQAREQLVNVLAQAQPEQAPQPDTADEPTMFGSPPETIEFAIALGQLANKQRNQKFARQMRWLADEIHKDAARFTQQEDGSWISVQILGLRD